MSDISFVRKVLTSIHIHINKKERQQESSNKVQKLL